MDPTLSMRTQFLKTWVEPISLNLWLATLLVLFQPTNKSYSIAWILAVATQWMPWETYSSFYSCLASNQLVLRNVFFSLWNSNNSIYEAARTSTICMVASNWTWYDVFYTLDTCLFVFLVLYHFLSWMNGLSSLSSLSSLVLEGFVGPTENQEEQQYLSLVHLILTQGQDVQSRNSMVRSVFVPPVMRFSLQNGRMPILTCKRMPWKTCFKELLWFLSGNTNVHTLQNQGVRIWNQNATPEYLATRHLDETYLREAGELGPIYGFQWRHFNGTYAPGTSEHGQGGVDQLSEIVATLKDPQQRSSRRIIMTAWNPSQNDKMALPPCHLLCQFYVSGPEMDQLSCVLYQRSGDVGLGVPFNIASYAFLTHLIADCCGLKAHEFIHALGDAHIYKPHMEAMASLLEDSCRTYPFPTLTIHNHHEMPDEYTFDDIQVEGYQYDTILKMECVA